MRKVPFTATAIILVLCVTSVSVYAANAHGPVTQAPHGHANVTHGPSTPSTHATTTTTTKTSTPTSGTSSATTGTNTTSSTATTTGGKPPAPPISPIARKIASHPQLAQRITALLPINPKTGKPITLNQAALGFKNQGQFIAALQAARRMNCATCFMQIKTDMTKKDMSLGQAIQDVRHTSASAAATEAAEAEHDADRDLRAGSTSTTKPSSSSGSTTTTTSTSTIHR
jgi:hypothetical protein